MTYVEHYEKLYNSVFNDIIEMLKLNHSIDSIKAKVFEILSKNESDCCLIYSVIEDCILEAEAMIKSNNDSKIELNNRLSWDEYFMNVAILASLRSKDTTKVGAVITSKDHKLLGMGYNGLPSGIDESLFPTTRDGKLHLTKYAYCVHAEQNALCNLSNNNIEGSTVYVTLFPCCYCASILLQHKIKEVVYLSDKHHDDPEYIASRKLFDATNIIVRQYEGKIIYKC